MNLIKQEIRNPKRIHLKKIYEEIQRKCVIFTNKQDKKQTYNPVNIFLSPCYHLCWENKEMIP